MFDWIRKLFRKNKIGNRRVTKARFLYLYVIFGSTAGLIYFVFSLFAGFPWHWSLTPIYLLAAWLAIRFIYKNWTLIWIYISDIERGKLLLFLNEHTHYSEPHKLMVIDWVYLKRRTIRLETWQELSHKALEGKTLSNEEKRLLKYRVVICPQQVKDGFNEAVLVNALIYAHNNIQVLDKEIRRIMHLTDHNMLAFDLGAEHDKCLNQKHQKLIEIGKNASKKLSGDD